MEVRASLPRLLLKAQSGEGGFEVGRQGGFEFTFSLGFGVNELEPLRVQHKPWRCKAGLFQQTAVVLWAVGLVAGKREADVLEMDANLVGAARVQRSFDVSCPVELFQNTIARPRVAAGILGHGHAFAMAGVARD